MSETQQLIDALRDRGDKLCADAADRLERQRRDHIGAHRINADTIRHLEAEIERLRAGTVRDKC